MIPFFYFAEENYCQHYVSSKGFSANCWTLWTKLGNDSQFPECPWFLSDLRLHFLKINLRGDWLDLCTNLELPQTHETNCNIRIWSPNKNGNLHLRTRGKKNKKDVKNDKNHRYLLTLCYQLSCCYHVTYFFLYFWFSRIKNDDWEMWWYWRGSTITKILFRMCGDVVIVKVPIYVKLTIITK